MMSAYRLFHRLMLAVCLYEAAGVLMTPAVPSGCRRAYMRRNGWLLSDGG